MVFSYPFEFADSQDQIKGNLCLQSLLPALCSVRFGTVSVRDRCHAIVLTHSRATSDFIYLKQICPTAQFLDLFDLSFDKKLPDFLMVPGQLLFGFERGEVVRHAILDLLRSEACADVAQTYGQDEMIVVPILREGIKYHIAEGIYQIYGHYCNEVVTDPHHVLDQSVPIYGRNVELTIFKDRDLSPAQKKKVKVAWIGDSIASGNIMMNLLAKLASQFSNLERVELIAPFATLRGIARLINYWKYPFTFRVHVFETILNALPPDFYYSAHFSDDAFHIQPQLEFEYRKWWGNDENGKSIADTACAGYGWSESFFSPREQIRMMNEQLFSRHRLSISSILKRHIMINHSWSGSKTF
jgi:hypothetical protein